MIEVEKKFILTTEQEKSLIEGADFLGEKKFTDIYYDDEDFSLTKKDLWLRNREGRFELKIPKNITTIPTVLKNTPDCACFRMPSELKLKSASTGSVPSANAPMISAPVKKLPVVKV